MVKKTRRTLSQMRSEHNRNAARRRQSISRWLDEPVVLRFGVLEGVRKRVRGLMRGKRRR